jgi:hypothetical protein
MIGICSSFYDHDWFQTITKPNVTAGGRQLEKDVLAETSWTGMHKSLDSKI